VKLVKRGVAQLQKFTDRPWFEWLVGFLAGIDTWVLVIPTDGLLISSVLLNPKKWFRLYVLASLGSTLGLLSFAYVVSHWGLPWISENWPLLVRSSLWAWTESLFVTYGLWVLLGVAATPLIVQPTLALAVVSHHSLSNIMLVVLAGRLLKYFVMSWVARWAPASLSRLWGVGGELKEVGIEPKKSL